MAAPDTAAGGESADYVFHDGPIYTVVETNPWARGLAVTGNAITYVGDEAGAMALAGPATRVVDLNGKLSMRCRSHRVRVHGLLDGDPHDIHRAKVTMTMMNGQIRHGA